jgi:hypothetical protein
MNDVKYYKRIFIKEGLVQYNNNGTDEILLIQKDTINNALGSFKDKPVHITHDSENIVGNVVDVYYDMDTAGYIVGFISDNKDVDNLLNNKKWGISCTYEILQSGNGGKYHEIEYNKEVYALAFKNLCIVENPRYQEAKEIINSVNKKDVKNGGVGSGIKGHRTEKEQRGIDYYKRKLQGKSVIHKKLGKIDFTSTGLRETIYKGNPSLLHKLDKTIEQSERVETKPLYKTRKDKSISFSKLTNKKIEILTRNFFDKKQFYLAKFKDLKKRKK